MTTDNTPKRDLFAEAEAMRVRLQKLIANPAFADTRPVLEIRLETIEILLAGPLVKPGERLP